MTIFILLLTLNVFAKIDPDVVQKIDKVVARQIGINAKSASVVITDGTETKFLNYGKSAPDSFYEIGSITKTFTSLMLSMAIGKDIVTAETTLGELRPEWKDQKAGSIRLIELATHRAGLPKLPCNLVVSDYTDPYSRYSEKELIASISDKVLRKTPDCTIGNHPSDEIVYSNWGSALLGNALSAKTGLSYGEMLSQWITSPLGMADTVVRLNSDQKKRMTQGHDMNMKPTGLWHRLGMMGNGAIMSTPADMVKYVRALLHPETTPFPDAIKRVQTLQYKNIAYNWFVTPAGNIWHNGKTGGHSSLMKVYLKNDFAVFWLSDSERDLECVIERVDEVPCEPNLH